MSCLAQICLAIGEMLLFISLSTVSSVQCCMVISGTGVPVLTIFNSHSPALRTGRSSARALPADKTRQRAEPSKASLRVMWEAPG